MVKKNIKSKSDLSKKNLKVNQKTSKLNWLDLQFIKLSVLFFAFWIITFMNYSFLVNYKWLWLILAIFFAVKPAYRICNSE